MPRHSLSSARVLHQVTADPLKKVRAGIVFYFNPLPLHNTNQKKTLTTPTSAVIGSDYGKYLGMIFCRTSHTGEALFYPTRSILVNLLPSCLLSPNQDQYKLDVRYSLLPPPNPTQIGSLYDSKDFPPVTGKKGFSHRVLASILLKIYISRRVRVYLCVCALILGGFWVDGDATKVFEIMGN